MVCASSSGAEHTAFGMATGHMKRVSSSPDSITALLPDADPPPLTQTLPPAVTAISSRRVCLFDLTPRFAAPRCKPRKLLEIDTVSLVISVCAAAGASYILADYTAQAMFASVAVLVLAQVCIRKACSSTRTKPTNYLHQKRASGKRHELQIRDGGVVFAMGDSSLSEEGELWLGHLGHGVEWGERVATPTAVRLPAGNVIVEVAAGNLHSLFLGSSGTVFSCGFGCEGPLGIGDERSVAIPRPVTALDGLRVQSIAAGDAHSLALCSQGAVWSWGWGRWGQLGHGDQSKQLSPRRIATLTAPVVQVAAGGAHSLALGADGAVFSFGSDAHGQCGHGTSATRVLLPTRVEALARLVVCEVRATANTSAALVGEEPTILYAWGQLGGSEAVQAPKVCSNAADLM